MTTKSFSTAVQESSLKPDTSKKMSAENPFGDKDIGTVLNEISDPNWIDPKKVQRGGNKDLDRDAFFKLMLTQMKHQDPMNPMQSHEMASQLAQFTSLEQLFNVNNNLEAMKQGQKPTSDYQALNFIGKEIAADSSKIVRAKDDEKHLLNFTLNGDAEDVMIKVKNADGEDIKDLSVHNLKKGKNTINWNGFDDRGFKASPGDYSFVVEAKGLSGKPVTASTTAQGRITGVQYTSKGPLLMVGDQTVYLSDVKKIVDPQVSAQAEAESMMAPMPQAQPMSAPPGVLNGADGFDKVKPSESDKKRESAGARKPSEDIKNQVALAMQKQAAAQKTPAGLLGSLSGEKKGIALK